MNSVDIDDAFDDYMHSTNPDVLPHSLQYRESRRCFFAGALVMFNATLNVAKASITEIEGERELEKLLRQLNEFSDRVKDDRD
jgi:hypothetical protein